MISKKLNIFISLIMIFSLIISVGAQTDISNPSNFEEIKEKITIEDAGKVVDQKSVQEVINHVSEDNKLEGDRVESITPEEATSEKIGAEPGQEEVDASLEKAPISSQTKEQKSTEENNPNNKDVEYIPLEEVLDETSSSLNSQENSNQEDLILYDESQNQKEDGSGQEEMRVSPGQFTGGEKIEGVVSNTNNGTTQENLSIQNSNSEKSEKNNADVRGNTQEDTGSINSGNSQESGNSPPVSLSSLGKKEIEYVSLSEILQENETVNESEYPEKKEKEPEVSVIRLYSEDRERVVERTNLGEIKFDKEEIQKSEFEKRVIISSEVHIETPITVETSLETEVTKDKIRIFWENQENLEITELEEFEVKFYDNNGNGLVDKISWKVPHLSEQIFEILIQPDFIDDSLRTLSIDIIPNSIPSGGINNPATFDFNIKYYDVSLVECTLEINDTSGNVNVSEFFGNSIDEIDFKKGFYLEDGTYNWHIRCLDTNNTNITTGTNSKSETFTINEGISLSNVQKFYFLNKINNVILNQENKILASSTTNSYKEVIIKKGSQEMFREILSGSNKEITLNNSMINSAGDYEIIVNFFGNNAANKTLNESFSVISGNIGFIPGDYELNKNIEITFTAESQTKKIANIVYGFGDGVTQIVSVGGTSFSQTYQHSYENVGDFSPTMQISLEGESKVFNIEKTGITIENSVDNEAPEINLIYPEHNSVIYSASINFKYKATDDVGLENCTFTLYNISGSTEVKLYNQTNSPKNGEVFEVKMINFDDGEYEWMVTCFDNSSNKDYDFNLFEVSLDNSTISATTTNSNEDKDYEIKEDLELVLEEVNKFLEEMEVFDADEKEFLEDFGILEDVPYYKKRLLQIDQYFKENYKYVDTEALREKKEKEYKEEFENIKNKIPKSLEILDSYEYVKNTIEIDLIGVVQDYMESTNTQISSNFAKKLAKLNAEIQQEISVKANIKEIRLEYSNETLEFIFVKKKLDIKDGNYNQILEIIPKEIAESSDEIFFLIDYKIIKKDPIFEILKEDLTENGEIIYYIKRDLDLKDLTKTETILFEESFTEKNPRVTGFFVGGMITDTNPIYFALILLLLIIIVALILFVLGGFRRHKWKREPNVVKCFELLRQSKIALKEKDVERARENYREIKKIYPVLPKKPKDYFYKEIKELSLAIDRKDIFGLVKEYEEARRSFNKEACLRIYGKIKKVYERLPPKDRQKIYERIK